MRDEVLFRLRERLRPLRRGSIVGPLMDAWFLRAVLRRMTPALRDAQVLGPEEFAPYVRVLTPVTHVEADAPELPHDWVIVRQDQLVRLPRSVLHALRRSFTCTFANRRYLLFRAGATRPGDDPTVASEARARLEMVDPATSPAPPPGAARKSGRTRAILVTTYDRPVPLERTLPQLGALDAPILVVDDGSAPAVAEVNREVASRCGAWYLRLPRNRGLSAALNVGLSYLLADPAVQWISYFQEDVDVVPDLFERLAPLEDPETRPILTGYDAPEHAVVRAERIEGVEVKLKRESPGVHVHASADYWRGVLPIPTEYLGAPKRRWESSLEDSWIFTNAPRSAANRGILVPCVPGLVRTFLWHPGESTWGNPNVPNPPLQPSPSSAQP